MRGRNREEGGERGGGGGEREGKDQEEKGGRSDGEGGGGIRGRIRSKVGLRKIRECFPSPYLSSKSIFLP